MKKQISIPTLDQAVRPLNGDELAAVAGGFLASTSSQVVKTLGEALSTMARKQ